MESIFLIGFMGSGKSSIGKMLSKTYDLYFVDTDIYIEQKYNQHIPDIFKMYGEKVFRDYEHEALREVTIYDVVATGGGIVERESNMMTMEKYGTIVYLHTSFKEIEKRLKQDVTRPLWKNSDYDSRLALYTRRDRIYSACANHAIQTDGYSVEEIVQQIGNIFSLSRQR